MITKISTQLVAAVGRHNTMPDSAFNQAELKRGRQVEHEHNASNPDVQEAIAKDHLAEIPDYYTRLDKMEAEGKAALKKQATLANPTWKQLGIGATAFAGTVGAAALYDRHRAKKDPRALAFRAHIKKTKPEDYDDLFGKEASESYSFGSLQLDIDGDLRAQILKAAKLLKDEDLAEDGRETNPHCSVLYGLHETASPKSMPILGMFGPQKLRLGAINIFECPSYDVVKIEVESPSLTQMNWILRRLLPHTSTHKDYNPHITLGYVKKGKGKDYERPAHDLHGVEVTVGTVQHSTQNGVKTPFQLKGYQVGSHVLEKLHKVLIRPSRAMLRS